MKSVYIEDCFDCPNFELKPQEGYPCGAVCNLTRMDLVRIQKTIGSVYPIPDGCPLDDAPDDVEATV